MSQAMTLARPYARAAFAVARDASRLPEWSDALGFAARVAADPQVAALLGNPKLTRDDVLVLLAPDAAGEEFSNFLGLLFDNRRLGLLPEIAGLFDELRFEAEHVMRARITSASIAASSPGNRTARKSGNRLKVLWPSGQYHRATRTPGGVSRA